MISWLDVFALVFTCTSLFMYHVYLYTGKYFGAHSQLSANLTSSKYWMLKHSMRLDTPTVTLAVQTFRNTIVVAVFIGGFALNGGLNALDNLKDEDDELKRGREIIIATFLNLSFLSWVCVIRLASHMGFMIGAYEELKKAQELERDRLLVEEGHEEYADINNHNNNNHTQSQNRITRTLSQRSVSEKFESLKFAESVGLNAGSISLTEATERHHMRATEMLKQMFEYFQ